MAKPRNRHVDFGVYVFARLAVAAFQAMPMAIALRLADGLAWLVHKLDRRHRQVASENLRFAFPGEMSAAAIDVTVKEVYRHFCRMMVEIIYLGRKIRTGNWHEYLEYASPEQARLCLATLLGGRPVLLVTGHFGNWELSGYIQALLGFPGYAIARPLDNPYLDAWFRRWREEHGQKMIAKKGEFDRIEDVLKSGNLLATLGDQDAGSRGLFVNFFNRPASTHKAIALLAIEHNVPIMVIVCARVGKPVRYRLYIEDVIEPAEFQQQTNAVKAITERFTQALERLIRKHPEQYFWVHRRWKHQPPASKKKAA
jgi:Kdo2-lipid IVA lauroyltransferase/acyltransferase